MEPISLQSFRAPDEVSDVPLLTDEKPDPMITEDTPTAMETESRNKKRNINNTAPLTPIFGKTLVNFMNSSLAPND